MHRILNGKWRFKVEGAVACMLLGYVFFENILAALFSGVCFPIYEKMRRSSFESRHKKCLKGWFKEMLYALSTTLSAGSSMEQALFSVQQELETLYSKEDPLMIAYGKSLQILALNGTVEEMLFDLNGRLDLENIKIFADIFSIANRSGGDLVQIIRETVQVMNEQAALEQEIETMMAQKKFEFRLLSMMVPFILIYFKLASPGYLSRIYEHPAGYVVLGMAYILFWSGMLYGDRLTAMEVGL